MTQSKGAGTRSDWIIIRDPGCVPDQKGPFLPTQVAGFLREVFAARPTSLVEVITVHDGGKQISVQDGPQCLMMIDGRSTSVALRHIKQCRAALKTGGE